MSDSAASEQVDSEEAKVFLSVLSDEHLLLGAGVCVTRQDPSLPFGPVISYPHEGHTLPSTMLCDISYLGKIRLAGEAAGIFVTGLFDFELTALQLVGAGVVAHLGDELLEALTAQSLSAIGETVARTSLCIIRSGEHEFMLLVPPAIHASLVAVLQDFANEDDSSSGEIALSDETDSLVSCVLIGHEATDVLASFCVPPVAEPDYSMIPAAGTLAPLLFDEMPTLVYHTILQHDETCYIILCPLGYARALWRSFLSFVQLEPVGAAVLQNTYGLGLFC